MSLSDGGMAKAVMGGFGKPGEGGDAHDNILIHPLNADVDQDSLIDKDTYFKRTKKSNHIISCPFLAGDTV